MVGGKCAIARGWNDSGTIDPRPVDDVADAVEAALAKALSVAAERGDLETVGAITAELRERRQARAGVSSIAPRRVK
jgi:hypothetical protein